MIDFHSHVLPKMDDGSTSVAESLQMLRMEKEQGIRKVVATPHFYAHRDSPEHFFERRNASEKRLREAAKELEGCPEIAVGAEVHFFPSMSDSEILSRLTIGDTGYILVEMPMSLWSERMYEELGEIHAKQRLVPIVAHLDRYIGPMRSFQIPERLAELPVVVQVNASFFLNRMTAKMALRLLKEGKVHLLGSDCHNLTTRVPNIGMAAEVIQKKLGDEALQQIRWVEDRIL